MTVSQLNSICDFSVINMGNCDTNVIQVYCCDLLSIAMGKAPKDSAWITVMGNVNTIAVATLTDVSCIVLASNINLDEKALSKAKEKGVWVLQSSLPIFETALKVYEAIQNEE
jgi:hypothetical protein